MLTDAIPLLHGVRVLDASRILAGPLCGQMLGDLGADVIKIERPGQGDDTRTWGPPFAGPYSAYFLSCNRNKKSLALDISQPAGQTILHRLLDEQDVFIENFRFESISHMGLTPEELLARHPRLICCSISGYGRTGPMRDEPGYDAAIQAMSGLMAITGPLEGPPSKVGVAVADVLTGLQATIAILACLRARERSNHGYAIDLALLDCAVAAQVNLAQAFLTSGQVPERQGNAHLQIVPYQTFATQNGWIVLSVGNDSQWRHFCLAAHAEHLSCDVRFASNSSRVLHRTILIPLLELIMKQATTEEWCDRLSQAHVTHSKVYNYAELFTQEQVAARGLKVLVRDPSGNPVELLGSPMHIQGAPAVNPTMPPRLGEHTASILQDHLGFDACTLEELRHAGIIEG